MAHAAEDAAEALAAALDELPATVDFALAFCANFPAKRGGTDPLAPVLECLSRRMPPGREWSRAGFAAASRGGAYAGCTLLQRAAPLALKFVRLLLPPPAGTQVAGCSGRGIFGILPGGEPAEIDPSTRQPGISLLLGRVPGARAHAFSCKRPEGARAGGARGVGVAPL